MNRNLSTALKSLLFLLTLAAASCDATASAQSNDGERAAAANARRPENEAELKYWLGNMLSHHGFSLDEASLATGLSHDEIRAAMERFDIRRADQPVRPDSAPLLVLPYPGGRHPRIGFLDGAVDPQRETKISVFTPWDPRSYVVVDVPEAIWCQSGLLYLAHTHVETIWTQRGVTLPRQEWNRHDDGHLDFERSLPNGVVFGATIIPRREAVHMELWLTNGGRQPLTDLRVQNCVMLKAADGFQLQTSDNKVFAAPYAACRAGNGRRWVITAWSPCHRPWGNDRCPCLHSDPKFPDCAPGETKRLRGWLSFYEGDDLQAELERIQQTNWQEDPVILKPRS